MDKNQLDVTYDGENRIWRCCSTNKDGSSNCSDPTEETFSAPPPSELSTIYPTPHTTSSSSSSLALSAPSSSFSSSSLPSSSLHSSESKTSTGSATQRASNTLASTPTTPTAKPTSDGEGGGGLHTGDKIALGIGVPGTIATIAGAYFAYAALKKRSQRQTQRQPTINERRSSRS